MADTESRPLTSSPVVGKAVRNGNHRTARIIAIVAGLLGAAMAMATPLLPVEQTTATLNWPQNGVLESVNAPLIGYVATDLTITVPCQAAAGLVGPQNAGRTVLVSTVPKQAPKAIDRGLLIERVDNNLLVIVRNTPVVSAPLSQVLGPDCRELTFTAHADKITGEFVGLTRGPEPTNPAKPPVRPFAANAAATTSVRRSSGCSPTCPAGRRRAWSSPRPSTPATAPRRRC